MTKLLGLALVAAVVAGQRPAEPQMMVNGVGASSCGLWLEAYAGRSSPTDARIHQFDSWLDGYATAVNANAPALPGVVADVLKTDQAGRHAFFARYCGDHPVEPYFKAVQALLDELRKR